MMNKNKEMLANFAEDPKVVLLVLDDVYERLRTITGNEALFGYNKDLFFVIKKQELILGNKKKIVKIDCKDLNLEKTCKQLKKFGLTYSKLHETEIEPCTFKSAVHKAGDWLGLPL